MNRVTTTCGAAIAGILLLAACPNAYAATILPATITSNQTWTTSGEPYELHCNVYVDPGVTVTVEPGVTVMAMGDWRLTIAGNLTVQSDGGTRAVFRAPDSEAVGAWKGLYFVQDSTGLLEHCSIRSGEYGILGDTTDLQLIDCRVRLSSLDAVYVWSETYLRADDCNFQDNGRYGLHVQTSKPWGWVRGCIFDNNGSYAAVLKATCIEMLDGSNTYQANAIAAVGVDCGSSPDIEDTDTWVDQGVAYDLTVGGAGQDLEIAAGASLRMRKGIRAYAPRRIVVDGEFLVAGIGQDRVIIAPDGSKQTPGEWLGIQFNAGSSGRLANMIVRYAREGVSIDNATVELKKSRFRLCELDGVFVGGTTDLTVTECTFRECGRSGVRLPQPSTTGSITGSRFIACGDYPVYAAATSIEMLGAGNIYRNNTRQAIGVSCDLNTDISDDDTWTPQSIPCDLTANAGGSYLRIGDGGRLELSAGTDLVGGTIGVKGTLVSEGADGNRVTFGSNADAPAPGDWTGVEFLPGGAGQLVYTTLTHAQIGVSIASNNSILLDNSTISNCSIDGVRLSSDANPTVRYCTIHTNTEMGIKITATAQPLLGISGNGANPGQNSIYNNGLYDLYNNTALAQRAEDNWWDATTIAGINALIYDHNDNAALGLVDFQPYLTTQPAGVAVLAAGNGTLAIMSVAAIPTANGAAIHVSLSQPADVRITIRNIAGRTVRTLIANVDKSAIVTWDRRSTMGTAAPAGRYLVEVEAHSDDGGRARGLAMVGLR